MIKRKIYKIQKLGKVEKPFHPESNFGDLEDYYLGYFTKNPTVGERFNLLPISWKSNMVGISTSPVAKIIDNNTFETLNSIYHIEEYVDG